MNDMKIKLTTKVTQEYDAKFIRVSANVRHWEDGQIDGVEDESGDLTPFRNMGLWTPVIDIDSGTVIDWPIGTVAKFHYKVCDAGSYQLLDEHKNIIAEIVNNYVPSGLCHGDEGHGDYIIFSVEEHGKIVNYKENIRLSDWQDEEED